MLRSHNTLPAWQYGKMAPFGPWFRSFADGRMLVLFYKGFVFQRTTSFLWKDRSTEDGMSIEFKQKMTPAMNTYAPCGGFIPAEDFPINVFAADDCVVYASDDLTTFKKLKSVSEDDFYAIKDGSQAASYTFPTLDDATYVRADREGTSVGLLVPIMRIDVEQRSDGTLVPVEICGILASERYEFGENEEEDDEGGEPELPCTDHTDGGVEFDSEWGGGGGDGTDGSGVRDSDGQGGVANCVNTIDT